MERKCLNGERSALALGFQDPSAYPSTRGIQREAQSYYNYFFISFVFSTSYSSNNLYLILPHCLEVAVAVTAALTDTSLQRCSHTALCPQAALRSRDGPETVYYIHINLV